MIKDIRQKTIAKSVLYAGVGLHSGKQATMRFKPLPPDNGIIFERSDLPDKPRIPATAAHVTATVRATTLKVGMAEVFTIEHVLAALFILGIDNCLVEMDGPEPPVADGSALPFIDILQQAEVVEQDKNKKIFVLDKSFSVHDSDRYIVALPYNGLRFSFLSINEHPLLGTQYLDVEEGITDFAVEIAPARTIAFMHEIETLQKMGLGLGGSMENVIIYDKERVLTPLRFADELVRHKLLDVLGDLFLAGRFYGHVIAVKSAHALNTALAAQIADYIQKGENV